MAVPKNVYISTVTGKKRVSEYTVILPLILIAASMAVMVGIGLTDTAADESEAATELPVLDVKKLDGSSLTNVGAILDDTELEFTVSTSPETPQTFIVPENTVLVSGKNYLILSGSPSIDYSLTGHMFGKNTFVKDYGLRLALYSNIECTGIPVASAEFFGDTTYIMGKDLRADTPYYIKVETVKGCEFPNAPNSAGIGFGFTASTSADYNAVHFRSDGEIVGSNLFRNGEKYVFPAVTKEGSVLIGWCDQPGGGTLYRDSDIVKLDGDTDLYAFWWAGGAEKVHYETLDGSKIDIETKVTDKVLIDVDASTADGRVTVSIKDAEVAKLDVQVPFTVNLSGKDDSLKVSDAEKCSSMSELIGAWFTSKGLRPVMQVTTEASELDAEINALRALEEDGFTLKVGASGATMDLDRKALGSVFRQAAAIVLGKEESEIDFASELTELEGVSCKLVIRPATDADTTERQKEAIGGIPAWYTAIIANGEEITDLGEGRVTLTFPYSASESYESINAYRLTADGTKVGYETAYDGKNVTVESSALSVYVIEESSDSSRFTVSLILIAVLLISMTVYVGVRIYSH